MPVEIIDFFKPVKIDIDEAENAGLFSRLVNEGVKALFKGETVVDVSEQVKLRSANHVGVKTTGFNRKRGETRGICEHIQLRRTRFLERIECGEDRTKPGTGTGWDFVLNNAHGIQLGRAISELRSIVDLTPTGCAFKAERNQFRNLLNNFGKRTRAVDVFKDLSAAAFNVR